jgi:uncharacterized tellurite resistance protein B-like protein
MKLPPELSLEFRREYGCDPKIVARALHDLENRIGETYLAANDDVVALFSRPAGGSFSSRRVKVAGIEAVREWLETPFVHLELQNKGDTIRLKFSCWDRPAVERFVQVWQSVTGKQAEGPPICAEPESTLLSISPLAAFDIPMAPLPAFCAAMHAMMEIDGHVDTGETLYLSRAVPDFNAVQQGSAYLRIHGVEGLLKKLPERLEATQKLCLFANLFEVALTDGLLRSREQELLEKFGEALQIDPEKRQWIEGILMLKGNLTVLLESEHDGPSGLVMFAACLHAMAEAGGNPEAPDLDEFARVLGDPELLESGRKFLHEHGLDGVLAEASTRLSTIQRQCIFANLVSFAMADDLLRRAELELIERIKERFRISDEEYASIYQVLYFRRDLTVFTSK